MYVHDTDEFNRWTFVYVGSFLNGFMHGRGKKLNGKGYKLVCEFVNGRAHGFAKVFYKNGSLLFEGEYRNGKRQGSGKLYY